MLTDIEIKNFRGFRSLKMNNLGRITLVGGRNGVGKTALLEALWMLSAPDLPGRLLGRLGELRGLLSSGPDLAFHDMFFDYDTDSHVKVSVCGDWSKDTARTLEIFLQERQQIDTISPDDSRHSNSSIVERITSIESETEFVFKYKHSDGVEYTSRAWWFEELLDGGTATPPRVGIRQQRQPVESGVKALFISSMHRENLQSLISAFSKAQLQGDVHRILSFIKILEPRLTELTLITTNNIPVIHARLKGVRRLIPVQLLGEGLNRVLCLALLISEVSGGMLLIDEIENGLHYRVQGEVFCILLELAKAFDVQIFATTHSRECIVAAHQALNGDGHREFAYYRLHRGDEEVKAYHFDSEMLDTSIEFNMEQR